MKNGGLSEWVSKMTFWNKLCASIKSDVIIGEDEWFKAEYGTFIVESPRNLDYENAVLLGNVISEGKIVIDNKFEITLDELIEEWEKPLEKIFPTRIVV